MLSSSLDSLGVQVMSDRENEGLKPTVNRIMIQDHMSVAHLKTALEKKSLTVAHLAQTLEAKPQQPSGDQPTQAAPSEPKK